MWIKIALNESKLNKIKKMNIYFYDARDNELKKKIWIKDKLNNKRFNLKKKNYDNSQSFWKCIVF